MGADRQYVIADPRDDASPGRIESRLTGWDLRTEVTARVNDWVAVVGIGDLTPDDLRAFLEENLAGRVNAVVHVRHIDSAGANFGYLYHSDGKALTGRAAVTEREYSRTEVFDYFKREYDIDGAI